MAVVVKVGGVDWTSKVVLGSLKYQDALNSRDTASFTIVDDTANLDYCPEVGNEVTVINGPAIPFGGTVERVKIKLPDRPTDPTFIQVSAVDFSQLCDRHLVVRAYTNQTAGYILKDIVANDLLDEGITTEDYVEDGPVVAKAIFNYSSVSSAFDDIAKLVGYSWYVDSEKRLHFFSRESYTAPFSLSDSSLNFNALTVESSRQNYVNKLFVRAGQDLADQDIEYFKGDYARRTFTLTLPCGTVPTVTVDSVSKTVGIGGLDTGKDWYWNKGQTSIYQDGEATPLNSGNTLAVTYRGLVPIIVECLRDDEIQARQAAEGGTGVYEDVIEDSNIETHELALEKGNAYLREKGVIRKTVSFKTFVDGLHAGQVIGIDLPKWGADGGFLIASVSGAVVLDNLMLYNVSCTDAARAYAWTDYFKALYESGRKFVVKENEVVHNLRTNHEEVVCGDSLSVVVS